MEILQQIFMIFLFSSMPRLRNAFIRKIDSITDFQDTGLSNWRTLDDNNLFWWIFTAENME